MRKPKEKPKVEQPTPKPPKKVDLQLSEDVSIRELPVAIDFIGLDGKKYRIAYMQRKFVEHYLLENKPRIQAIIDAGYDVFYKDRDGNPTKRVNTTMASVMACKLLKKANICAYVTFKLKEYGFDDNNVDKQHLFLLNQFEDMNVKAKAIDMYYKKTGAYSAVKVEHTVDQKMEMALDRLEKLLP